MEAADIAGIMARASKHHCAPSSRIVLSEMKCVARYLAEIYRNHRQYLEAICSMRGNLDSCPIVDNWQKPASIAKEILFLPVSGESGPAATPLSAYT